MATNTEIRPWRRRKTEAGRKTHPAVQKGISPRRALSVCAAANSKQRTARLQQQPPSSRPRHVTHRQRRAARKHRDKIKAPGSVRGSDISMGGNVPEMEAPILSLRAYPPRPT